MSKTYTGDTGTVIVLDCGANVSAATARAIDARRPDGTLVSWAAVAEGIDSIKFTTFANSLDQPGDWKLQSRVTLPSGTWRGETVLLRVFTPFE